MRNDNQFQPQLHLPLILFVLLALFFYLSQINYQRIESVGDNFTYEILAQSVFTNHPFKIKAKFDFFTPAPIYQHEYTYPPLLPVVFALGHLIFGPGIYVNFILNCLITVTLAFVIYSLGLAWLQDPLASFLAAVAMLFSTTYVETAVLGLSEPLFMLTSWLAVYFIYRHVYTAYRPGVILAGIFCGLAYLARASGTATFIILLLFLLVNRPQRQYWLANLKTALLFLGVTALTASPWLIRNYLIFGDPLFYVGKFFLGLKPGAGYITAVFQETPTLLNFLKDASWRELSARYWGRLPRIFYLLFLETHLFLLLAGGGIYLLFKRKQPAWFFLAFFFFSLAFTLLHAYTQSRFYIPLTPLIYLLGAHCLSTLFSRWWVNRRIYNYLGIGALVLVTGIYAFFYVAPRIYTDPASILYQYAGEWLKNNTPADAVVMTERTPDTAYYSERPAIMNPRNLDTAQLDKVIAEYNVSYFIFYKIHIPGTLAPSGFIPIAPFTMYVDGYKYQIAIFKNTRNG